MGIPPATLASIARLMPAWMARSQISEPQLAISSLLAVTTDFLLAIAPSMISAATEVPPTSSATMSTSGCETTSRQSVVRYTGPSDSGSFFASTDRLQTAVTRSGNPSLSAIWPAFSASSVSVPDPTLPKADNADVHLLHLGYHNSRLLAARNRRPAPPSYKRFTAMKRLILSVALLLPLCAQHPAHEASGTEKPPTCAFPTASCSRTRF